MLITIILMAVMSLITLGYQTEFFTWLPCGFSFLQLFYSNYVHLLWSHLLINMIVFWQINYIERLAGSYYLIYILVISALIAVFSMVINYWHKLECSIGFSGVLYGLIIWYMLVSSANLMEYVLVLASIAVMPLFIPNISVMGHLLGCLAGLCLYWIIRIG